MIIEWDQADHTSKNKLRIVFPGVIDQSQYGDQAVASIFNRNVAKESGKGHETEMHIEPASLLSSCRN